MIKRRMAGVLLGVALAAGLSTGMGAAAQAATVTAAAPAVVIPVPGVFYELTPPFITPIGLCADVPSASSTVGVLLQVFHCHGYGPDGANQLWAFVGPPNGPYQIQNKNSHLCMKLANQSGVSGTRIKQDACLGLDDEEWMQNFNINDPTFDPTHFALTNQMFKGECLAAAKSSDVNQPLVVSDCNPPFSFQIQTWQLG
jgi:Ricin-type beta-trefoil lectin domain